MSLNIPGARFVRRIDNDGLAGRAVIYFSRETIIDTYLVNKITIVPYDKTWKQIISSEEMSESAFSGLESALQKQFPGFDIIKVNNRNRDTLKIVEVANNYIRLLKGEKPRRLTERDYQFNDRPIKNTARS